MALFSSGRLGFGVILLTLSVGSLIAPRPTQAAISLPIEVIGPNGTMTSVEVEVTSARTAGRPVRSLWMLVHSLSYPDKASIQINGSKWMPLNNTSAKVAEPGKSFGGIGGAFSSLRVTLPLAAGIVQTGRNTIRFRFNKTDGVSIGFRVLDFNLLTDTGKLVLPPDTFQQDDPDKWLPPDSRSATLTQGEKLWRTAVLRESSFSGKTLKATCSDCHAQDGRDLKYFNFSNLSIVERSKFHGLTSAQGTAIAGYIRSLKVPNPGRPWNPPYQPGPGLDSKPVSHWAAGAGLQWVLDQDIDSLPYIFPNGITREAVATSGTLNLREIPIALQLPDWNHWLPHVHPKDAWGTKFLQSDLWTYYAGEGKPKPPWNRRDLLKRAQPDSADYALTMNNIIRGWDAKISSMRGIASTTPSAWTPAYAQKVYSLSLWRIVKNWEAMQEYNLEGLGPSLYPDYGEARTWFTDSLFHASTHALHIPNEAAIGGSSLTNKYFANVWYELQALMNSGNRHVRAHDWPYAFGNLKDLHYLTNVPEGMRQVTLLVKAMQMTDNAKGLDSTSFGWNPTSGADVSLLANFHWQRMWKDTPSDQKRAIMEAILANGFEKNLQFAPHEYYKAGLADPTYIPPTSTGNLGDRIWAMIPKFREAGVDDTLLNAVCDWAQTLWPKAIWTLLKQ